MVVLPGIVMMVVLMGVLMGVLSGSAGYYSDGCSYDSPNGYSDGYPEGF